MYISYVHKPYGMYMLASARLTDTSDIVRTNFVFYYDSGEDEEERVRINKVYEISWSVQDEEKFNNLNDAIKDFIKKVFE